MRCITAICRQRFNEIVFSYKIIVRTQHSSWNASLWRSDSWCLNPGLVLHTAVTTAQRPKSRRLVMSQIPDRVTDALQCSRPALSRFVWSPFCLRTGWGSSVNIVSVACSAVGQWHLYLFSFSECLRQWSRFFFEKLVGCHPLKKLLAIFGTRPLKVRRQTVRSALFKSYVNVRFEVREARL